MNVGPAAFEEFAGRAGPVIVVEITGAEGSTPRERGAFMLVSGAEIMGTIGGGQLEFMAIAAARELLGSGANADTMAIPLGPEIGQCCGGRVELALNLLDEPLAAQLLARLRGEAEAFPAVYVFGAGHVGTALAFALAPLPLRVIVVETRRAALAGLPEEVATRLTAIPEAEVRSAPPNSLFVVLTHDHALDFLIVREALARTDASYVGMIGSKSKRARYKRWHLGEGGDPGAVARLACPIGGADVHDKRPAVIAALTAAELVRHIGPNASMATRSRKREAAGSA